MKAFFASAAPYELARGWTDGLWNGKPQRVERMRKETDKALALTAHRLLCYALKTVYNIMPQARDFGLEPNGKPFFVALPDVHFSISHSGSMTMCAVHDKPVGADIEKIRVVGKGVAERVMSAEEHQAYMNAADKQRLFFQIWTLKEAYVKFSGDGLGMPLGSFTVFPTGDSLFTNTGCSFWMMQPMAGYQAAVCAKSGVTPDIIMVDTRQLAAL